MLQDEQLHKTGHVFLQVLRGCSHRGELPGLQGEGQILEKIDLVQISRYFEQKGSNGTHKRGAVQLLKDPVHERAVRKVRGHRARLQKLQLAEEGGLLGHARVGLRRTQQLPHLEATTAVLIERQPLGSHVHVELSEELKQLLARVPCLFQEALGESEEQSLSQDFRGLRAQMEGGLVLVLRRRDFCFFGNSRSRDLISRTAAICESVTGLSDVLVIRSC